MVKLADKGVIPVFGEERVERLKADIATWQDELIEAQQSLEAAKDRVLDIRASWQAGSREFTAGDKQEADAEVERLGLLTKGLQGRIKRAQDKLPQMDTRHAEGVARLIHEAYGGTIPVEVQAGKFDRELVGADSYPMVVVTPRQDKLSAPTGEHAVRGRSDMHFIRREMDAPLKTHLLTAVAKRYNLRYAVRANVHDHNISDSDATVFMPSDASGVNAEAEVIDRGSLEGTVHPNIAAVTEVEAGVLERWALGFVQRLASEVGSHVSMDDYRWAQSATKVEFQKLEDGLLRFRVKTFAHLDYPNSGRPSQFERFRASLRSAPVEGLFIPGAGYLRKGFRASTPSFGGDQRVATHIEGEIVANPTA